MDGELIKAVHTVDNAKRTTRYSAKTEARLKEIEVLSELEKQRLYIDTYRYAVKLAEAIISHKSFKKRVGEVDLSEQGLGKLEVQLGAQGHDQYQGMVGGYEYVSVVVPGIGPDEDTAIYLNVDGSLSLYANLENDIPLALDYVETLEVFAKELGIEIELPVAT